MLNASARLDHWPSVVAHVSAVVDLETSARDTRALLRRRGVRSAAGLLHLALLYGPGGLSLRGVASFATEAASPACATSRCSTGCATPGITWPTC